MARKRLVWQFLAPFLAVTLLALLIDARLFSAALDSFHLELTQKELEIRARVTAAAVEQHMKSAERSWVDAYCKKFGSLAATRLTVILPDGRVVGDTSEDPGRMENHADRPEIAAALGGVVGMATRFSQTLQQKLMYVAVPVTENGRIIGCVRASLSLARIDRTQQAVITQVISIALAVALGAAIVSLWIARRITRPLEVMREGAERFANGELGQPLPIFRNEELAGLAGAMNEMASQLDERIRTVVGQRNEQEAILASMIEGVLALDRNQKILRINQAAATLLGLQADTVIGRSIQEVLRKPELQRFISEVLQSKNPIENQLKLISLRNEERHLQLHGAPLRDAAGGDIGALIVINDITRLQRLENIRRDFVANVSHELKTPITAIKGSVETLQSGALAEPGNAVRFLDIIARQADRLNAIIEDLLSLSRIEQEEEKAEIQLAPALLSQVIQSAIQSCQLKAEDKRVQFVVDCPAALEGQVNAPLFEQALVNLIDNAIKYSNDGGEIHIAASCEHGSTITVRDFGCGIERQHLPRLFERFYRVDKARSRKLGGTGLGLAIVKHIIQAHGGQIEVESAPGEGTIFTITLPR